MGCFPFANSRFQMGVTVMGFAEDFGQCVWACCASLVSQPILHSLIFYTIQPDEFSNNLSLRQLY